MAAAVNCPICHRPARRMLGMPGFPVTERYEPWKPEYEEGRGLVDQAFWFCEPCSHGALEHVVPDLYDSRYRTRTSLSTGARQAVSRFAYFVQDHCGRREYFLDIGGNDGEMRKYFDNVVVVDPHAENGIKAKIEDADITTFMDEPKIIASSHCIEHLEHPDVMLGKCAAIMQDEDYLALQFPSLELLLEDARIDQIHHQHLHYFSLRSITLLLARHGLRIVHARFDPQHWGALMVIAVLGAPAPVDAHIKYQDVLHAIERFDAQMGAVQIPAGSIALGAALMLPVLAYWLPQLENVSDIYDEDETKEGLRYINFNRPISGKYTLHDANVVVTAIGTRIAARSLTAFAIERGARSIILPLQTL